MHSIETCHFYEVNDVRFYCTWKEKINDGRNAQTAHTTWLKQLIKQSTVYVAMHCSGVIVRIELSSCNNLQRIRSALRALLIANSSPAIINDYEWYPLNPPLPLLWSKNNASLSFALNHFFIARMTLIDLIRSFS